MILLYYTRELSSFNAIRLGREIHLGFCVLKAVMLYPMYCSRFTYSERFV